MASLPPSCANCLTSIQTAAGASVPGEPSPSRLLRSSDGKMRIDLPNTTVITDPSAQHTIVLDHVTREAQLLPLSPPTAPQVPPMPQLTVPQPGMPQPPQVTVQSLGKNFIDGHPVDGQRFVTPTAVSEIWTSSQFQTPVLTKITTPNGVQTTYCKSAAIPEPDPSMFQVPAGYKVLVPKR